VTEVTTLAILTPEPQTQEVFRWTTDNFLRAVELGLFPEDKRVELINGRVFMMVAPVPRHNYAVHTLHEALDRIYNRATGYHVREEKRLLLSDGRLPAPDLMVVRGQWSDFKTRDPRPGDVELVIEVSDTTRTMDTGEKALTYAQEGIPRYRVLDLNGRSLIEYSHPSTQEGRYQDHTEHQDENGKLPGIACHRGSSCPVGTNRPQP
jgi:hypothetical protein